MPASGSQPQPLPARSLPAVSKFLYWGFSKYARRLIAKRFCAMRVVRGSVPTVSRDERVLVYLNHVGWWDPLVGVIATADFFAPRQFYAPIDAAAVEKYAVMNRLGFFAVDQSSPVGLRTFLRTMQSVLDQRDSLVMITPHGRFVDARDHQSFQPGLGHVVSGLENVTVIPLACEYPFWNESTPELLLQFGEPVRIVAGQPDRTKQQWTDEFEQRLMDVQGQLAGNAIARNPAAFDTMIGGRVGTGGVYDFARRVKSWFGGRRFDAAHEASQTAASDATTSGSDNSVEGPI